MFVIYLAATYTFAPLLTAFTSKDGVTTRANLEALSWMKLTDSLWIPPSEYAIAAE